MYALFMITLLLGSFIIAKQKVEYRKLLIVVNSIVCCVYIVWRIFTIPLHNGMTSFIVGTLLFFAEVLGIISLLNFKFFFTKKYKPELRTLADFKEGEIPSVDVLICTYNEPLYLLEKTIAASTNLDYPKDKFTVHICDDGRRSNLKSLCEKYNVNYITRNDNEGAKAGNINNALQYLKGDLFAVLDADMIPKKEFLTRTVGHFSNENLAFVQVPQAYYNQDVYQYNLGREMPNEQDFFMRDVQEARAACNAVLHVGTNAVFKREYVNEIGGYPTCSITEDMAVGMLLQSKGYDSLLINEELVLGLSANTFNELVKQRDRWCRGNIQALRYFNPLFTKGLTFAQKIAYFDGGIYWFSNVQKIIFIICPLIYLLTSNLIIDAPISNLLNMYIPFLLGQILMFRTLTPGTTKLTWGHFYTTAMAPYLTVSILKELLFIKTKFNVTSKEVQLDRKQFQLKLAFPHVLIIGITVLAWVISTVLVVKGQMNVPAYLLNMGWSTFNFVGSVVSILVAYQKPLFRSSERITVTEKISVNCNYKGNKFQGKVLDISGQGIGLKLDKNIEFKLDSHIEMEFEGILFHCKIARITEESLGLTFKNITPEHMKIVMSKFTNNMHAYYKLKKKQTYTVTQKQEQKAS